MSPTSGSRSRSVAEEAGVSLSTISKVLNGRTDVSPRDPRASRGSSSPSTATVRRRRPLGVARRAHRAGLPRARPDLVDGAHRRRRVRSPRRNGLSVVLTVSGSRHAPDPDWIEGVMRRRPVGIVLVFSELAPEYRERLRSRAIPFVIVDPAGDPSPDAPSVGSANWSGGLAATRHLIELGHSPHRRDHRARGHDVLARARRRLPLGDELRRACRSTPAWIRFGDFHVERRPRARARELLALARPPDRDLRGQRPAGARRARSGARAPGCAFPTTSRSSATTTSRSPAG